MAAVAALALTTVTLVMVLLVLNSRLNCCRTLDKSVEILVVTNAARMSRLFFRSLVLLFVRRLVGCMALTRSLCENGIL